MYWLINSLFPTSVGINTFLTRMHLAVTTTYDGGAPLTTQGTHICLILSLILRGGRVAVISPNMRRDMLPWSIRRVTDLPPNAKFVWGVGSWLAAAPVGEINMGTKPMQKMWIRAPYRKWPKKMPGVHPVH